MMPIDTTKGLVFTENNKMYTLSLNPGVRVYGEKLNKISGQEYREWDPRRSKLSAYIKMGGKCFPIKKDSNVLYLGASSGTTASHISDMVTDGRIFCVEFSPRMFRDLVNTCAPRDNMVPILGDATSPQDYGFALGDIDLVYSDVAQKKQADIIADNFDAHDAKFGIVAIKARSEDVTSNPIDIYKMSEKRLIDRGFTILESVDLEPYENAHRMIVFKRS